jgi:hypothetical protein
MFRLLALLGLTAIQNIQTINQAKKQAGALVREGEIAASNKARDVMRQAARQRSSFLTSGLTLEGTPEQVIGQTYDTGLQDVNLMRSNTNTQSKNIIGQARSQMLSNIMGTVSGFAMGSGAGFESTVNKYNPFKGKSSLLGRTASAVDPFSANRMGFGIDAYNALEQSDGGF